MFNCNFRYRYLGLMSFVFSMTLVVLPAAAQDHSGGHMMHGGHGGHGMIIKGVEKFSTTAYEGGPKTRPVDRRPPPAMTGNPVEGKKLAFDRKKGRCLTCHIMGADTDQPGNVGPNLSSYGTQGRSEAEVFQQVWDARANNQDTMMPPFGTNDLLTEQEVIHIVSYLKTLKTPVPEPARPEADDEISIFVAGEDLTMADIYIEQGEQVFKQPGNNGRSCKSCHAPGKKKGPELVGVAATYPKYDSNSERIISLEDRIGLCRDTYMNSDPYRLGSSNSNLLSSYVKFLSRRVPVNIVTDGPAADAIERGKSTFFKKTGQLNFSCADCHNKAGGKWLRGQELSIIKEGGVHSGTAPTWPRHFVAGHDLGLISLQQRIRHCQTVTRTNPLKLGSQEYTEMELYMTVLANGQPMLAPTKSKLRGEE